MAEQKLRIRIIKKADRLAQQASDVAAATEKKFEVRRNQLDRTRGVHSRTLAWKAWDRLFRNA